MLLKGRDLIQLPHLGFQGVLIGDYLDTKTTITHSFRADSTQSSKREVTVEADVMGAVFESTVIKAFNVNNVVNTTKEMIAAGIGMSNIGWTTKRSFF